MLNRILLVFISFLMIPWVLSANTLEESVEDVAIYFKDQSIKLPLDQPLVIQVVNYHNQETDPISKKIEAELYQALEKHFPGVNLVSLSSSISGINVNKVVIIKGTYEKQGTQVKLRFQALLGMGGNILAQTDSDYETEKKVQKTLVAVLDIEADQLSATAIKAYSDIFRTALSDLGNFNLASSADIDKMNPDAIQKTTGCTRDECATIIGEQLGVDRTVSTSLFQLGKDNYVLSGKMINIKDGAILVTKTVQHNGSLVNIHESLNSLARQLVGGKGETKQEVVTSEPKSNLLWHIATLSALAFSLSQGMSEISKYNNLSDEAKSLETQYQDTTNSRYADSGLYSEIESNRGELKNNLENVKTFNSLILLTLLIEGYFIYDSLTMDDQVVSREQYQPKFSVAFNKTTYQKNPIPQITYRLNW